MAADKFVSWANAKLEAMDNYELVVQTTLPEKRVRKKKRMPGEILDDEPVASSDAAFEVNVHNVILDTVAGSMDRRFSANAKLASDFACLDPKNFPEIRINGLPNSALQEISKCLLTFDNRATVSTLQTELSSLAYQWERLKKSSSEGYTVRACSEVAQEGQEDSGGLP